MMHSLLRDKECHGRHSYKTIRTNTMQLTNKRQERNDCLRDDSIKQEELLVAFFLVMCARADGAESFCDDALARWREGVARDSTVVSAYVHTHVGGRCPGRCQK